MKAELVLMGKRVDMAARTRRRALVVLIYSTLVVLMAALFVADHWRTTGYYLVFATFLVNRLFLGGYNFGGLIKPFNGKPPQRTEAPPFLLLAMHVYPQEPVSSEYRSDEREMQMRDRAHYQAYQALAVALAVLWLLSSWNVFRPHLLAWIPASPALLIYGLVLATIVVTLTLPQAILLWTEPDMEELSE
ncbi:MAG TPA: hypothetical protein VGG56_15965 [Terracidiphilus sp.]|jgi:hypothetical protein